MSKVDDELTRRLQRAERPVDGDDLFEGLERRRSHRERLRRVQAGLVAFAVLAATAGGFAILRDAFDTDESDVGATPSPGVLGPNGEIVFVKDGDDARLHIFAAQPDGSGERQITDGPTRRLEPRCLPRRSDGRLRTRPRRGTQRLAIVGIDGGDGDPASRRIYLVRDGSRLVTRRSDTRLRDDRDRLPATRHVRHRAGTDPIPARLLRTARGPNLVSGWNADRTRRCADRIPGVGGRSSPRTRWRRGRSKGPSVWGRLLPGRPTAPGSRSSGPETRATRSGRSHPTAPPRR